MAYDEGLAHLFREELADLPVTEKKMFGGLAFMLLGNMVCGIYQGQPMFRIGAGNVPAALAIAGVSRMQMKGKPMVGYVDCTDEAFANDESRATLLNLATVFVKSLPAK